MPPLKAVAVLTGSSGTSGVVSFVQDGEGTTVSGKITGLAAGEHGFHVHALLSTGAHLNPANHEHGAPEDDVRLNVTANADGIAEFVIKDTHIPLSGPNSIIGRAVVVHADPDDLGKGGQELSKSTGNAGAPLACGVIGLQAVA